MIRTLSAPHPSYHVMSPRCALLHLFNLWLRSFALHLGSPHVPACPWHFHTLTAPCTPHATFFTCGRTPLHAVHLRFPFLVHENPLLFLLLFLHSHVIPPRNSESKLITAMPRKPPLLVEPCCPELRHFSSVQHCSIFCQFVRPFISFSDNSLKGCPFLVLFFKE